MKRLSVLAAVVLVVLMVHALGGSATRVSPLASCTPDCTGVADQGLVADPMNCTNYYVCQGGTDYGPFPCESGNEFSPDDGSCVVAYGCTAECGGGANCPLTCNGTVASIGDVFECNVYYYCTPAGPSLPQYCSIDTPYYDGNAFACSADPSVCCSGYCTPYCTTGGFTFVPDPTSCTDFYVCPEEGDVDENLLGHCDTGEVFSVQTGTCVTDTGEPCQTLCDAVGGGGGDNTPGSGGSTPGSGSSSTSGSGGDTTTPGSGGSTDSNGCVSSLDCTAAGNFAACSTCQPVYFHCSGAGASGELERCPDGYVFNPLPANPICVLENHCPYPGTPP